MISINIISADNPDFLGNYTIHKSLIQIGSSHTVDIYCPHTNLADVHCYIEIQNEKLILNLNENATPILVNKKITTGFKNLKVGDILTIEEISFKIIDFQEIKEVSARQKLNETAANLREKNPELLEIINYINENL